MNLSDDEWTEYQQRAVNNIHGVFLCLVGAALRDYRISLDQFSERIGMNPKRMRRLLTGSTELTLHDLSGAACGVHAEIVPNLIRIKLEPIMTEADLGLPVTAEAGE